jgi:serine/threonine protein kinase
MSPEQAQSFPDIDGRTDLFSVGAIMYEMLVGEPPHSGPTYEAVLIAICTREAADVREKAPAVPAELAEVIARALRRDRAARYASASEMLAALEALNGGNKLASRAASEATPPERFRTLVFAVVAALAGFAVAAYLVARGGSLAPEASGPAREAVSAPAQAPNALASAPALSPLTSVDEKPMPKAPAPKSHDAPAKTPAKKVPAATSAGVAGGLGLSTREP